MNDLIEKIIAQTGLPVETVRPVIGAMLAHMGDILPAPIAHQVAILLGIHQEDGVSQDAGGPDSNGTNEGGSGLGGLLGGLAGGGGMGGFLGGGGGGQGGFAGAGSLMSVAESLLAGVLSGKR